MTSCPYFPKCGGCVLLDLSPVAYAEKKDTFIRRCFADHGLNDIPLAPLHTFPVGIRRRANLTFDRGKLGYFQKKTHTLQDIKECLLLTEALNRFLPPLKQMLSRFFKKAEVFLLDTPFGIDVHITADVKMRLDMLEALTDFARSHVLARLMYNGDPLFQNTPLSVSACDFLQPSLQGEQFLQKCVLAESKGAKKAVDLFCGKGTFTYPLLEQGLSVQGYDIAITPDKNIFHQRDLFRNPLPAIDLNRFDMCVIDPPRAGALEQTKQLAESKIRTILMISCFPATASRDIRILTDAGWILNQIVPVDQFQFSNHVELVCVLRKDNKSC